MSVRGAAVTLAAITRLPNVYGGGQRSDLEGGAVAIFSEARRAGGSVVGHVPALSQGRGA